MSPAVMYSPISRKYFTIPGGLHQAT